MAEPHDPAYVAGLATSLRANRPDLLHGVEDDLARLRRAMNLVALWVNNPAYDDTARRALAELLGIPAPRTTNTAPEGTRNGN